MYLSIKGKGFSEYIFKEISVVTDHALLDINSVKYDDNNKYVVFFINRFELTFLKKRLFESIVIPKYDKTHRIKSKISVGNIINFRVENNYTNKESETSLERGLYISDNNIYICSMEEDQGNTMYSISIDVSELDITITDVK